jgi:hypothetical protein
MQSSGCQIGIVRAIARFSNLLVPVGQVPSGGNALTGSSSPRPSRSSRVTRCTIGRRSRHRRQRARVAVTVAGTGTSCSSASAASSAPRLRFTTSGPRRP